MKWAHVVRSASLDGPGGHIGRQLQKERPVPASPLKFGVRVPSLGGEEEVIVAWRDLFEEGPVFAPSDVPRVIRVLFRIQIADDFASGPPSWEASLGGQPRISMCCDWPLELASVQGSNNEEPLAQLRHSVISRVENLHSCRVSERFGSSENVVKGLLVNLERHPRNVFQDKCARAKPVQRVKISGNGYLTNRIIHRPRLICPIEAAL